MTALLEVRGLAKSYREGRAGAKAVLDNVDFALPAGAVMSLTGPSGSGKSTLLHLVGLVDRPDAGEIRYAGENVGAWKRAAREDFRAAKLGFAFQRHLLLNEFTLLENVLLPAARRGETRALDARARGLLERLGIADLAAAYPPTLSGGEAQRAALCRALLNRPALLLLDEPTGNLDPGLGRKVMEELFALARDEGSAVLLVTHNLELAAAADLRCELRSHRLLPAL